MRLAIMGYATLVQNKKKLGSRRMRLAIMGYATSVQILKSLRPGVLTL
jgi:hypothetical protein